MANVYVMCGKVGSGKTTFAKRLRDQVGAVVLSVDEWMLTVYGREVPCSEHKLYVERIKEGLFRDGHKILKAGVPIILDFGFWTKEERMAVRNAFSEYEVILYYMDVPEAVLFDRVHNRNKAGRNLEYHMSRETQEVLNKRFEVPSPEEGAVCIKDGKDND